MIGSHLTTTELHTPLYRSCLAEAHAEADGEHGAGEPSDFTGNGQEALQLLQ